MTKAGCGKAESISRFPGNPPPENPQTQQTFPHGTRKTVSPAPQRESSCRKLQAAVSTQEKMLSPRGRGRDPPFRSTCSTFSICFLLSAGLSYHGMHSDEIRFQTDCIGKTGELHKCGSDIFSTGFKRLAASRNFCAEKESKANGSTILSPDISKNTMWR